ncbi:urea ABC transporter permease subunit UrtC [Ottowia sp.]|uniref:urea ABC transporter permease subunit UrtC n=1 Tax=Ottowia sp. TaxID=1898956 RepID=UPI002BF29BE0|nr:urea ABC transporter permease subunit UrtC [Ottowia sp.]HRN77469.1 urea ABC transporter permease subunit UrtC [Ottowia sp.]
MQFLQKRADSVAIALLMLVLLIVFPLVLDDFRLNLMGKYLAYAFVAVGIALTWGYGGVLSLGQGIFFGMGGYMMAMFLKLEASSPELPDFMVWSSVEALPIWWLPYQSLTLTVLALLVLPALLAYVVSYAVFRKRVGGVYFAIVTLALAMMITVLSVGQQGQTGGANGITDFRTMLGWDILSAESKLIIYIAQVILLGVVMVLSSYMVHSRYGKVLVAIRDREDRVRFSGYDTAHYKAFAFTIAAIFSAIGGAFYSLQVGLIAPGVVGVVASIEMVIYAAVGGRLSIPGAVVGAIVIGFLKSYLSENFPEIWLYFLGAIFILVVVAMPNGLAGIVDRLLRRDASPRPNVAPGVAP